LHFLSTLDRRWIYVLIALSVGIPMVFPLKVPLGKVSAPSRRIYEFIEKLPPDSVVWFGFDYYATTRAETEPGARAVARHLFRKGHRIVATSFITDGALISQTVMNALAKEEGKKYGVDYAILGYKAGGQIALKKVCDSIPASFPSDVNGRPLAELPILRNFRKGRDAAMAFTASDTRMFDYYAIVAATQYGVPVTGVSTAVMVPELYPYVNSGQILGILAGLKGSAEYEQMTNMPGEATRAMDAQSVAHLVMVTLIILSNIVYFSQRPRRR